jgi:hypothetical protein
MGAAPPPPDRVVTLPQWGRGRGSTPTWLVASNRGWEASSLRTNLA